MIRVVGSIVVAILMIAIPILATLSWVCDWHDFTKFIFAVGTLAEAIGLVSAIYTNAE